MDAEERKDGKSCLTATEWNDSQKNESHFWKAQKVVNNIEQTQRNCYYKGLLEDGCDIAKRFFEKDFSNSSIADIGSGPQGILHTIDAKLKVAVDPLMNEYREQGYDVDANNVVAKCRPAEHLFSGTITTCWLWQFDYIVCLNALDHMKDPKEAIANMAMCMMCGGELLLITDLRTPEQLDAYHKLSVTEEDVLSWLDPFFEVLEYNNYPHQAGNPIRQLIVHAKK